MVEFVFGVVVGAVFSPLLLRLAKLGWNALSKNVEHLEEKHGDE
jgi:hypothetical protein